MTPLSCIPHFKGLSWDDKVAYLAYRGSQQNNPAPPVSHRFEDIWYVRSIFIPAGAQLIGQRHIDGHILKLLDGKIVLLYEVGQKYFEAPARLHSRPGERIVAVAQTDCIAEAWVLNPDGITDITVLANLTVEPAEELLARGKIIAERIDHLLAQPPTLMAKD